MLYCAKFLISYKRLNKCQMYKKIFRSIKYLLAQRNYYDDSVSSWYEAKCLTTGYESEVILNKVKKAYLDSQQTPNGYERDSVVFDDGSINWPLVTMIYWCKHFINDEIKVIDFGGSFASQYFQNKRFFKNTVLKWSVVEQKSFARAAREIVKDKYVDFYENLSECITKEKPDFALLGSSLQYLENPYQTLKEFSSKNFRVLMLDRIPMHRGTEDIVVAQRVPKSIYNASYPAWIFSEEKLRSYISEDWSLLNVHESIGAEQMTRKGIKFNWKGHIYIRTDLSGNT